MGWGLISEINMAESERITLLISDDVNIVRASPIKVARWTDELVGLVIKVTVRNGSLTDRLRVDCTLEQATFFL